MIRRTGRCCDEEDSPTTRHVEPNVVTVRIALTRPEGAVEWASPRQPPVSQCGVLDLTDRGTMAGPAAGSGRDWTNTHRRFCH